MTVSGAGSVWNSSGMLYVGNMGSGALTIADGAVVSDTGSRIGMQNGSAGHATVTGAGSVWNSSLAAVGFFGDGTLTIADGGMFSANSVTLGAQVGGKGALNIGAAEGDAPAAAGLLDASFLSFGPGRGHLVLNHTERAGGAGHVFGAMIGNYSGGDSRISQLAGFTRLTGNSRTFQGDVVVGGGILSVEGTLGAGSVTASVASGALLTVTGVLGGDVAIASGGILSGTSGVTFAIGGDLELEAGALVHAALGTAGGAELFAVGGDLTLAGTLEVTDAGGFEPGLYTIFSYGGALTDNGFTLGSLPAGPYLPGEVRLQTSLTGQVNLLSSIGVDLVFWDGDAPASLANGAIEGGGGVWSASSLTFTDANGLANGPARPDPAFVVFTAAPGAVSVDDSAGAVAIAGAQFAVDGYLITGDAVELAGAETLIRVGDGTAAGADYTATIASALTGTGQLVKTDLGTLILTGANSYGGGVEVRGGTLVGDADSLVGDIVNDATLIFDQTAVATYAGAISGDGEAFKAGAGMLTLTGANAMDWTVQTGGLAVGAAAFAGDVAIETGASFSFDPAAHAVWSGVLSGTGDFDKLGDTTLTLTGDSSGFDGMTAVLDGLLLINGALGGQLVIGADGALGGSGAIGQLTIADGAIVAPGNSIGTLNVNGDLVLAAGSTYEVEVDPTGTASDLIAVTGTATIEGGTVRHIGFVGDYAPSSTYTILTAAGGVSGAFDAIETDFAFLDASLDYEATAVLMTLERNQVAFPDVGETANQRATGAGVESTGTNAALYGAVIGLSADNARLAFDQLSGELHGSVRSALVEDSGQVRGLVGQRLRQTDAGQRGVRMWAQGHGAASHMGTDGNAASLRSRVGGLWLGAEGVAAGGLTLGAAIGADRSTHDSARAGEAERDGYRLAAYGSGRWGAWGLSGGVAAAWDDIEAERTVLFPGFAEQLEADYSAQTTQAFAEATWTIPAGPGVIEPFASIARVHTETDGFTETGGAGALTVQDQTQEVTLATLGLGARRDFDDARTRTGSLEGRLGWRHASGDLTPATDQAFAGGTAFIVNGLPVDEEALVAEIGGRLDLGGTLALKIDWTGQAGDHTAQRLAATLSWRF